MVISYATKSPLVLYNIREEAGRQLAACLNVVPGRTGRVGKDHPEGIAGTSIPEGREKEAEDAVIPNTGQNAEDGLEGEEGGRSDAPSTGNDEEEQDTSNGKETDDPKENWKKSIDLGDLCVKGGILRTRVIDMLSGHRKMWSGVLGEINTTEHRIYLKAGRNPSMFCNSESNNTYGERNLGVTVQAFYTCAMQLDIKAKGNDGKKHSICDIPAQFCVMIFIKDARYLVEETVPKQFKPISNNLITLPKSSPSNTTSYTSYTLQNFVDKRNISSGEELFMNYCR